MLFFFFMQKTAYEVRISDGSSDVCSSDLCAQVIVVGVEAFRLLALSPFDLGTFELRRDRADDACGHLILQVEDIVEGAFESLGPDMGAGRRIDELSGDTYALFRFAQAALQHVAHAELAPHLLQIGRASCRERGGQYVYILVVAGTLKKKK